MVSIPKGSKILSGILNRADVVGSVMGLFENLGGIGGMAGHFTGLITNPVAPNWYSVWDECAGAIGVDIGIVIGGAVGDALLEGSGYAKYFRALAKFGAGKIMGNILGSVIANSHNPGRGAGGSAGSFAVYTQKTATGPVTTSGRRLPVTTSSPVRLPST